MPHTGRNASPGSFHDENQAGWIVCCICLELIHLDEYRTARCWTDPNSITCAAHAHCLMWIGEHDLDLPAA